MVHSARRFDLHLLVSKIVLPTLLCILNGCGGGDSAAPAAATPAATESSGSGDSTASAPAAMAPGGAAAMGGANMSHGASGMPSGAPSGSGPTPPEMMASSGGGASSGGSYPGMAMGMGMPSGAPGSSYPGGINPSAASAVPSRPANSATWTDKHFQDAARERDPNLPAAIDAKVKSAPGDPKVADLLASLLLISVEKPAANGGAGTNINGAMPNGAMPSGSSSAASRFGARLPGMSALGSSGGAMSAEPPTSSAPGSGLPPEDAAAGAPGLSPQSRLDRKPGHSLAVDSLSLMIAESATAYMQSPAVGAVAGRAGAMAPGQHAAAPSGQNGAMAIEGPDSTSGSEGMAPSGYPGGSYPGMQAGGMTPGGAPGTVGSLDDRVLVQHIVDGLIQNGSPKAWQTVYGIAAGTVKTPLDLASTSEIVVFSLFRNLDKNQGTIEQILLSILDGTAAVPPESRASFLRAMATISASAADKLTGFKAMPASGAPGGSNGMPGAGMMAGMSSAPGMSAPGMAPAGMSTPGMSGFPGSTPSGGAAAGGKAADGPLSAVALMNAAGFLWNTKAVTAIAKQLESAVDPISAADILMLSASIPNQEIRHAELVTFTRLHSIGADGLNSAGFFKANIHDPGMQVVLKSLPRQKPPRDSGQAAPLDSWTIASQDLAVALRDQLRALSSQPGKLMPAGEAFPVRLHKNAVAQVSGMIKLPGAAGEKMKGAAPTETTIYYARTSFSPQRPKEQEDITEHYESRASGVRRADQTRGMLWIDGVKANQNGTKRSTDVIIQAATGGSGGSGQPGFGAGAEMSAGGSGGASGNYSIEIIVVETSDPKSTVPAASQASTKP